MNTKKDNSYSVSSIFLKLNQFLWRNSFFQKIRILFYFIDGVILLFCPLQKRRPDRDGRKKVLIVYNMALGDGIMFYGPAQSIRQIWPKEQFEITIACQSAFALLYENAGVYDRVLPLDFFGSVVNLRNRMKLFHKLRAEQYDIVVDPVGCEDCTTNVFVTRAVYGKKKIGVFNTALSMHQTPRWMRNKIYDEIIEINQKHIHLIQYYGLFFKKLGAEFCKIRPAELPRQVLPFEIPDRFFIIFPVASMEIKNGLLKDMLILHKRYMIKLICH